MASPDTRKKITGIVTRRRFQALAAAGVLSIGLGIGAVGGAFAAPATQVSPATVTPVASPAAAGTANPKGGHGWGGPGPGGFLGPVATFLGISQTDLRTALTNNQTLAQVAVAHGKTATDLKTFLLDQESAEIDRLINNPFPQPDARGPGGPGGPGSPRGGFFGADIPTFLGISASDYRTALQSGQTPAQIAAAHGKTAADLKAFLTTQLKTRLDADVSAGRISSQQETDRLSQSSTQIDQFINNTQPARGPAPTSPSSAPTATATSG
jgi:hypothetical protein